MICLSSDKHTCTVQKFNIFPQHDIMSCKAMLTQYRLHGKLSGYSIKSISPGWHKSFTHIQHRRCSWPRGFGALNSSPHSLIFTSVSVYLLGTLRSNDGDSRENVAQKVNLRSFNLHRDYSKSLTLSNVGEPS